MVSTGRPAARLGIGSEAAHSHKRFRAWSYLVVCLHTFEHTAPTLTHHVSLEIVIFPVHSKAPPLLGLANLSASEAVVQVCLLITRFPSGGVDVSAAQAASQWATEGSRLTPSKLRGSALRNARETATLVT